jgi:hypothetical protein
MYLLHKAKTSHILKRREYIVPRKKKVYTLLNDIAN